MIVCWVYVWYLFLDVEAFSVDERSALEDFYIATNGQYWINNTSWLSPDPCSPLWYGVVCTGDRITQLNLQQNNISGSITSSIGNLVHLVGITLSANPISGTIPEAFYNLTNMTLMCFDFKLFF
eukprot:TRINITY_DN7372_c0_g3_i2.p1 TRINITY_DN7372_c0_g3~~TRINITY_DN7372_c0_g3_i2.p1  ORF type:complete len:124 (+),score=19.85 TRINITY_DN7372_c0_g3_i2:43-414(+)